MVGEASFSPRPHQIRNHQSELQRFHDQLRKTKVDQVTFASSAHFMWPWRLLQSSAFPNLQTKVQRDTLLKLAQLFILV